MELFIKKRASAGIGVLEVLIVMMVTATAFFGLVRLMNSSVKTVYYANVQKQTNFAAQSILDRINANLVVSGNQASPTHYDEGNSWVNLSAPTPSCETSSCNQTQQKNDDLYKWHQYLANLKISSLKGVVCLDGNTPGIPTQNSPNCIGGSNLYIKLVWAHNLALIESGTTRNYLIVPVRTTANLALISAWTAESTPGSNFSLDPTKMSGFWSTSWWNPMNFCSGANVDCSNSAIFGTCGTSGSGGCSNSIIFGACYSSSQNCSNSVIYGQCDSANCNSSFIMGNCNGSSCQNSVVYGQCSGNCSQTVVAGNCTGLCNNTIVYGQCSGTCTNSVVYGSCTASNCSGTYVIGGSCPSGTCSGTAALLTALTSALNVTITGNTANNLLITKNEPNNYLIDTLQTGNNGGMECSGSNCTDRVMGQCNNNAICDGSAINGNCGNNASCQSSIIWGNCGNNADCHNSIIKGNCNNGANCSNSQISGTCGNGANCSGSTCRASTASAGPC